MADISRYLNAILAAVYGEEVRGSIHDAIKVINDEASSSTSKSDNAVQVANNAKAQSDSAVIMSKNAVETANAANSKSDNAVATANAANSKSDNAVRVANDANVKSDTALGLAQTAQANSVEALRIATESKELSINVRNRIVNVEKIVNEYHGYIAWVREYLEMVDQTTRYITFDDTIQDSDGNNVLDSSGDVIGERAEGFAAFVRLVMDHLERTA